MPTAAPAPATKPQPPAEPKHHWLRQLGDELFFVFVIVMFFKLFLVDLYKIPTGSMTPTLIGGKIAQLDINGDGRRDLAYWLDEQHDQKTIVFLRNEQGNLISRVPPSAGVERMNDPRYASPAEARNWRSLGLTTNRYDRILVNKVCYWFKQPRRGEIVVFKVPPVIYRPEAPIYIKRLAGEPGETITFDPHGRLMINGALIDKPVFYQTQFYSTRINLGVAGLRELPEATYATVPDSPMDILLNSIRVPKDQAYVFGDNTLGSLDSRYWGGVPLENFKGRAFFRVMPFPVLGFLK